MEWKIITGQLCVTAIAIACIAKGVDHVLLYLSVGGLLASIGYPFVMPKTSE